jgi:hypothetical protein
MKLLGITGIFVLFVLCPGVSAESGSCLDAADESHHHVIFETNDVRVLLLELPRIASTEPHCHPHPYLYIVTGEGRSSTTWEGGAGLSHDWIAPEAHFVYKPVKEVVRNETAAVFRELIVESKRPLEYTPGESFYDTDLFPADLGSVKPSWSVSLTKAGVTAWKTQLAPGAVFTADGGNQIVFALTDLDLQQDTANDPHELTMQAQEPHVLSGNTNGKLTNIGKSSARFILLQF